MAVLEPEEFMTVAEVATILKLNQQTIRNWIDEGKLPALRIGRRVRIKREDFQRLLADSGPRAEPSETRSIWDGYIPPPVIP